MSDGNAGTSTVESQVPARLDRLPFSRWHWLVIAALGITWILDGLEVTMVGNVAAVLTDPNSGLGLSEGQVGLAGGIYIAGACSGALFFSYLTDRYGRKKLFMITLAIYLVFTVLTAFSWNFWSFVIFRFFTGAGIGGEYSAIYSAIDELIPARLRGQVALAISGSYWGGAALGSLVAVALLNLAFFGTFYSWRIAFGAGAVLGICVLLIRRYVPESPRWLATHGRHDEAEKVAGGIEEHVKENNDLDELPPADEDETVTIEQRKSIGFGPIFRAMFVMYPKRTVLGLVLMATQAFLYNAVLFTYGLILSSYYGVPGANVGQSAASAHGAEAAGGRLPGEPPGYAERTARKLLDKQAEELRAAGVAVAGAHLRTGRPAAEVVALAEQLGADLLVVGSGGPRPMRRAVAATARRSTLGRASDTIVRSAHCPVLNVRGEALFGEGVGPGSEKEGTT